ncbi:VanW family protein [Haliangium ochraceum]|uniref:VanW family protein n=1 Tax=Haliangium ochraceum (strain DSM 14365 / JCM 11303 / SMP-2) TaxID=502025 RepID=D0LXE2_HALO1|nr:VanW family protein [Haliangium ochraceum]ACY16184.1 VanW family protein [Haliangium ochraceum DSM 14365]
MRNANTQTRAPQSVFFGLGAALLTVGGGLVGGYLLFGSAGGVPEAEAAARPQVTSPEAAAEHPSAAQGPVDEAAVARAARAFLDAPVTLSAGTASAHSSWQALGASVDESALAHATAVARQALADRADAADEGAIAAALATAGSLPLVLERETAVAALAEIKARVDRAPRSARMDMEHRAIHEERAGTVLDPYASLAALEAAAFSGADHVELDTVEIAPESTVASLGIDDISQVLASFETRYSVNDHIRNFNLKLAASKLDGYVMQPGQELSFNEVVGARTENEGYKIAGVINAGEMVDGLAGGTCQISTTLHGAAFFAGLDIVKALPHSRPSTYAPMGMDATVVYPYVDVVLRNSYEFPVAIRFQVTEGKARVEILGRERPYDSIEFEREVVEQLEFDTVTREDEGMPIGTMTIDQFGFYGYVVDKVRKYYKDGKVVKRDRWKLRYRPVTEYVRTGVNPDPNLVVPDGGKKRKKRLREPDEGTFRMVQ